MGTIAQQAPRIWGGCSHGGSAWMIQLFLCKGPFWKLTEGTGQELPTPSIFSQPGSGESCIVNKWMDKRVTSFKWLNLHWLWLAVPQTFSCKHDSDKAMDRYMGICSCFAPLSIYTLMFGSVHPSSVGISVYCMITKSKLVICFLIVDGHFKR